jgi:uncharacterized protein
MDPLPGHVYLLLYATGVVAGFVDSIAGGGGLITVPVLLSVGIPPHLALGTNKLQSSFGSLTATVNYSRKKLVDPRQLKQAILFTAIGAALGTVTIQRLSPEFLKTVIPIMLAAILIYSIFSPRFGDTKQRAKVKAPLFYTLAGLGLGFYDGFFGPGAGSLWTIAFVLLMGFDLKTGTAHTKVTNFTSNFTSLLFFLIGGCVLIPAGLTMGAGQVCGAALGSRLVVRNGVRFVRFFFLCVVALTIAKVIYDSYLAQ